MLNWINYTSLSPQGGLSSKFSLRATSNVFSLNVKQWFMIRNAVKWKLKCLESLKHLIKAQIAQKCQTRSLSVGALWFSFLCLFNPLISACVYLYWVSIFTSGQTLVHCESQKMREQHKFYWPIKRFLCSVLTQQITPAEGYSLIRITLHPMLYTDTIKY